MIRDVDLVSYLPLYLQEFKENVAALLAENPEFILIWDAVNRVLYNHFISTADEYGISRFEKMLKIYPSASDNLESRRSRVQSKWVNLMPYTWKVLIAKLTVLCGQNPFVLSNNFQEGYTIKLVTNLENYGQVDQLWELLSGLLPCNVVIDSQNIINCIASSGGTFAGVLVGRADIILSNDFSEKQEVQSAAEIGAGISYTEKSIITCDFSER